MITRKPKAKRTDSPPVEWPTQRRQPLAVTAPAHAGEAWHLGTDRPMAWSSTEGKTTLH